jgi:hypothetical protein
MRRALALLLVLTACSDDDSCALLDGAPDAASDAAPPPPAVVLNEVDHGGREWVELYNPEAADAIVAGWVLTDVPAAPARAYVLPAGTVIPAGGHLRLRRQTESEDGFTFDLRPGVTTVHLLDDRGDEHDAVAVPDEPYAWTWGRLPDGAGWTRTAPTPDAANAAAVDAADALYQPFQVVRIDLEIDQAGLDSLAVAPRGYVAATLTITDPPELAVGPLSVGVRIKGQWGSLRDMNGKAALRVHLDKYVDGQRPFGLEHLVLNNAVQDATEIHEIVGYTIFRAAGVHAPRAGYAWVRVNGADFGLYVNLEDMDTVSLGKAYSSTAHLYEAQYGTDLWPGMDVEVDEGDNDDGDLEALITAAHQEDFVAAVTPVADLEQMRRMWAVEQYIGHWDGYAPTINNYYLHSDEDGVFTMLPWGIDQTFADYRGFLDGSGYLFRRCVDGTDCRLAYGAFVGELPTLVQGLDLDPFIDDLADLLLPYVEADPRREQSVDDFTWGVQAMHDFLAWRVLDAGDFAVCYLPGAPDNDGDGYTCALDCNDGDGGVHPGAEDVCNDGIDQDCSGLADDDPSCPECYSIVAGPRTYLSCHTPRAWADARAQCLAEGADLVVLDSPLEESALTAVWAAFAYHNCWLGLTDADSEGVFVTVAGELPTWTPWADGEPNNWNDAEDCAEHVMTGSWNDLDCLVDRAVVCELPCTATPVDGDGDGFASVSTCGADCDDGALGVYPGAAEICGDLIDQDCDGLTDEGC